jgi:phosphate transport system substrate-binding protein
MDSEESVHSEGDVYFPRFWSFLAVLALAGIACSQNSAQVQLVGIGTTTPLPIYAKWFREFEKTRPDLHFTYLPSGSGTGIDMVTAGTADFGSSDAPLTDKQLAKAGVLQFAALLGAIVPIYNVPGATQLKFPARALAGIYLGTITRWNDPAIAAANPEIQLPASNITVIHSAGGRGSTYVWSDYLSKVDVGWRNKVGRGLSVTWPLGKEGDGYGNIARLVKETPYSIGYVEFVYAVQNQLAFGRVQNLSGNFIGADSASMAAAAAAGANAIPYDLRAAITNAKGEKAYPIASYTWILISKNRIRDQAGSDEGFPALGAERRASLCGNLGLCQTAAVRG